MKLSELFEGKEISPEKDVNIASITDDSRKIMPDTLFFCIKGEKFDGHSVAKEVLEKGAAAVVCERDLGLGEKQILVEDTRDAYGYACAAWFSHPEKKIKLIGVTGTNGKTTTTKVIKHIIELCGHKTGLMGTIQNEIGDRVVETANTTPFVYDFMQILDMMVKEGCEYAVMEVSSFGLVQKRIGPSHFDVAIFTNLTQDHLDYHKTMENYYQAKKLLFKRCDAAVCNADDEYGVRLYKELDCKKYTYSIQNKADFHADAIKLRADGTSFWFCADEKSYMVNMQMLGSFNVSNVTSAIAACLILGFSIEKILAAVADCQGVKGRCETIPTGRDFSVICDYAHTPDAIENILKSVKEYTEGRLICLFGCGGNRDKTKRPKMMKAAEKYADLVIVTSDNPRDEEPLDIINDILAGADSSTEYITVADRREAIYKALEIAKKGDVIVLAGKGHEDYQILKNNVHIHMDEREIVKEGLERLN